MNPDTFWLITILHHVEELGRPQLVNVIVIIDANDPNFDDEAYMENETIEYVQSKLPSHISSIGPIIKIERMDDVCGIVEIK